MPNFRNLNKLIDGGGSSISKEDIANYYPSFGSKSGDYSSYEESEALPTEGMQGQGLATIIRNIVADKKPKGEFEEGGGGIEESAISPIDLVTPGMVAAPAKALGRGALTAGKAGLEAVESGAQALAKRYPELAKRLADNRGSIYLTKEAEEAAAREAYKAEFDANPIFYHGSPFNDIKEFIPSKEGMSGPGIYATTNPEVASEYATGSTSGLGNFLKQNKDAIKSPTVYPIKVRGKLFDRENPQDVWDLLRHQDPSLPNVDFSGEWWKDPDKLKLYNTKVKELENYTEAVKKSGMYTGIKTGDEHTAVIFDPKNVRSVFAKFDPAMKESGNISAGLAGAGLTFDQIKQLLDKNSSDRNEF